MLNLNILSLDLSTKSTGFSIYVDNEIKDYGCIQSNSGDINKRILIMRDKIKELILQYNINQLVIEEVRSDYKNIHTYKMLTWLQGIIVLTAYEINPTITIEYLQPSSWRKEIGIKTGRGIKREVLKQADIEYVKNKYNIEANDDICDSICLLDAFLKRKGD